MERRENTFNHYELWIETFSYDSVSWITSGICEQIYHFMHITHCNGSTIFIQLLNADRTGNENYYYIADSQMPCNNRIRKQKIYNTLEHTHTHTNTNEHREDAVVLYCYYFYRIYIFGRGNWIEPKVTFLLYQKLLTIHTLDL